MPTFVYRNHTISVRELLVRDRELIRGIVEKLLRETSNITLTGLNEYAAAVVLIEGGDEVIWKRPSPHASASELLDGLERWGELKTGFVDRLMSTIYSSTDDDSKN